MVGSGLERDVNDCLEEWLPVVKNTFVDLLTPSARDRHRQLRPLRSCGDDDDAAILALPKLSPPPTVLEETAEAVVLEDTADTVAPPSAPAKGTCYAVVKNSFLEFREEDSEGERVEVSSASTRSLLRSVSLPPEPVPATPPLAPAQKQTPPLSPSLALTLSPVAEPEVAPATPPPSAPTPSPMVKPEAAPATPPPATSQATKPRPGATTASVSGGSRFHTWTLDASRLRGNHKMHVSPPLEVSLGGEVAIFRMIVAAKAPSGGLGAANFQRSKGWGTVQVKCEADLQESIANVTYRIWVGSGRTLQAPRGPLQHNFAKNAMSELPRQQELWDFGAAVDRKTSTVTISLEEMPLAGSAGAAQAARAQSAGTYASAIASILANAPAGSALAMALAQIPAAVPAVPAPRSPGRVDGFDWIRTRADLLDEKVSSSEDSSSGGDAD